MFFGSNLGGGVGFGAREEEGRTVAGGGGASDVVPLLQSEQLSKNRQLIEMGGCEEGCFDLYVAHVFVQRVVLCWLPTRALHRKKTSALEIVRFDACKAQTRARFFLLCASAFWREKRETKIFWSRTRIKCLVVGYEPTCNIDLSETSKLWSVFVTFLWLKNVWSFILKLLTAVPTGATSCGRFSKHSISSKWDIFKAISW